MFIGHGTGAWSEKLLAWGMRLAWASCAIVLLFFFMEIIVLEKMRENSTVTRSSLSAAAPLPDFSYDAIGKGSLSLNAARPSQFMPWLGGELLLLGFNSRPDAESSSAALLLGVKVFGDEKTFSSGEMIHLTELDKEKAGKRGLQFSPSKSALSLKTLSFGRNSVTFEITRQSPGEKEEKSQLVLGAAPDRLKRSPFLQQQSDAAFAKAIKEAKHWGKDRFLEIYGGEEYRPLKEKEKVYFPLDGKGYVCFVKAGDFLVWEEGRWHASALHEISSSLPVAQVKIASPRSVEIEVWDETGFYHELQKIEAPASSRTTSGKETPLFSSIRLRNGSAVTCIAGKRRVMMREGDWILKGPMGWRNLKTVQQIEDCVHHKLLGELFIFDGLEQVQGKVVMKGRLFDEQRTQMQALTFPVLQDKRSTKSKERRSKR